MNQQKTIYEKWEEGGISILPSNPIVKLIYKRDYFDINALTFGAKTVTTIYKDHIVIKEYKSKSRKPHIARTISCSTVDFNKLCDQLETCINSATKLDIYEDDSSEELRVVYKYGRVQIVDRGLGNKDTNIGSIMRSFLEGYSP